jgi:hypothetical protein
MENDVPAIACFNPMLGASCANTDRIDAIIDRVLCPVVSLNSTGDRYPHQVTRVACPTQSPQATRPAPSMYIQRRLDGVHSQEAVDQRFCPPSAIGGSGARPKLHIELVGQDGSATWFVASSSGWILETWKDWSSRAARGAFGSLQPFLGFLGADAGGPGSHHVMQKSTWSFCLVAYDTLFCTWEETLPVVFGCSQWTISCNAHAVWLQHRPAIW